jgi:outer membrane protein TolC
LPPPALPDERLPIDLATTIRLADTSSPAIGLARARVAEALARQEQADYLLLPNASAGVGYFRHDGRLQDATGNVFTTSKGSLFSGGGLTLRVDLADAYFQPLVTRRLTEAEAAAASAVRNNVQLDAVSTYLDLLAIHAALAINADTLGRALQMLNRAEAADEAGLNKTKGDVPRARTEVAARRQERLDLEGRAGAVAARLARVLLLRPTVFLVPADPAVVPLILVPAEYSLDDLVQIGVANRPEVKAIRATFAAAQQRLAQARYGPLFPKVLVDYQVGSFGGGVNSDLSNFNSRGDLTAAAYWEVRNLGLGNCAQVRERQAGLEGVAYQIRDVESQVGNEVVESARLCAARFASLRDAQDGVRQAVELYRRLDETSFGMIGPRAQYDALEPLLAIQALNSARVQYLTAVIEFNRAQFRLYTALGQPSMCATPQAVGVEVPVVPPPFRPRRPEQPKAGER